MDATPNKNAPQTGEPITMLRERDGSYNDATPTRAIQRTPSLRPSDSTSISSSVSNTSLGKRKRRPTSPIKQVADMLSFGVPIQTRALDDLPYSEVSMELETMVRQVKRFGLGRGIFSGADAMAYSSPADMDIYEATISMDDARGFLGTLPARTSLERICEWARDSAGTPRCEAAWNAAVHYPLLDASLLTSTNPNLTCGIFKRVRVDRPIALLPVTAHDGDIAGSKKADFAIVLRLAEHRHRALAHCGIKSLNQTTYAPLRAAPIVVNIETKLEGQNWDDAQHQWTIWVAAQIAQINILLTEAGHGPDQVSLLPFPLFITQGPDWFFLVAEAGDPIVLWSKVLIGSTTSLLGTYQVVAALQWLMHWAQNVCLAWWERWILEILGV
ncbi:hypothetical protein B0A48_18486 [Cryoendolithus antarcticus]|uniref:PD-(D/E)XK nuclease-like domain-containing protein n=1 Tax=Cryoendolithus antarcticus TaxID=1507870 RepID=A0A1V8S8R0_9PEZI|nr:hypothetical protein B0A48_18486 [Cryoendolithus antarcticus]